MRVGNQRFAAAAVAVACAAVAPARANFSAYGLFGGNGVSLGTASTVTGGAVGSNATVSLSTFDIVGGATAGMTLTTGSAVTFNGPVAVNRSAIFGSATFAGPVSVGGNADFANGPTTAAGGRSDFTIGGNLKTNFATLTGDLRVGGNVTFGNGIDNLTGNLSGNGNVTLNGTVSGRVNYGTSLTVGPFGKANGGTGMMTTAVTPVAVAPQFIPTVATPLAAAGANVTAGGTLAAPLAPGTYGALDLTGDLYLTAGTYSFTNFTLEGNQTVHLVNLTPTSAIRVFISGDDSELSNVRTLVNEQSFATATASPNVAVLATNVLYQIGGSYLEAGGGNQLFGTLLLPYGSASFGGNTAVTGAVLANGSITSNGNLIVANSPSTVVPEPVTAGVLAVGVCGGLSRRRWRAAI